MDNAATLLKIHKTDTLLKIAVTLLHFLILKNVQREQPEEQEQPAGAEHDREQRETGAHASAHRASPFGTR